ncbi:MAG TPA: hypothetical protein VE954_11970 [Oligoflexus sp.]|uniref:hypothetical protein n=1 Tax=Oligoflexus sp. TaxID=1971216 RepID=UPI002D266F23|nr:hypothetical protein [Oligoflexus sp.]HYX33822.1 hypothetical protein [Oligoflexus sp.]
MFLKKMSVATLIFATAYSNVSFAQNLNVAEIEPLLAPIEGDVEVELDASDLIAEAEMDNFVSILEAMPEDLQQLPMNHSEVISHLNEHVAFYSAGQDRFSWACTKAVAGFAISTGIPVSKVWNALKAAKAVAGSWKGVAKMLSKGDFSGVGSEYLSILKELIGIDSIIKECF